MTPKPNPNSSKKAIPALDHALLNSRPEIRMPSGLHSAIMDEIRASRIVQRPPQRDRSSWLMALRWLPASAVASLALLALWWTVHHGSSVPSPQPSPNQDPVLALGSALNIGYYAPRTLTPAVVAPLSDELGRVNLDLENTARFLIASLP
jgi:hypothetical protein